MRYDINDLGYSEQEKVVRPLTPPMGEAGTQSMMASPGNSSTSTETDRVGRIIRMHLHPKSEYFEPGVQFLPLGCLPSILSEEVVEKMMAQTFPPPEYKPAELRREICGESRRTSRVQILVILVLIGEVKYIKSFLDNAVYDYSLLILSDIPDVFTMWKPYYAESFCDK